MHPVDLKDPPDEQARDDVKRRCPEHNDMLPCDFCALRSMDGNDPFRTIESLKAEVSRLTKERDEARADLEEVEIDYQECRTMLGCGDHQTLGDALRVHMDEARARAAPSPQANSSADKLRLIRDFVNVLVGE